MASNASAPELPDILVEAIQFEQSRWVNGPASNDSFYRVDNYSEQDAPGTLLKVDRQVNASLWSLPPTVAISRLVYQSQDFSGRSVPVSAYVLWPFSPRSSPDGYNVVAWAHGTTGLTSNYAPSNTNDLAHHFIGPYQLVLQGYVVVATDFAGLGVAQATPDRSIPHQYLALPAHANDVVYSVLAAREAFPKLSKNFVAMGYSQGGGATWAVAQRQARDPIEGYLGAVAICPITRILDYQEPIRSIILTATTTSIASIFSEFSPSQILSEAGQQALDLAVQAGGSLATLLTLLGGVQQLLQPSAVTNEFVQSFQNQTTAGNQQIGGPLLVIQGQSDPLVDSRVTNALVQETAAEFPDAQLKYIDLPGVGHNPAVFGSEWIWMDWIAQRFAGAQDVPRGLDRSTIEPALPLESYQASQNWWIALSTRFFETV